VTDDLARMDRERLSLGTWRNDGPQAMNDRMLKVRIHEEWDVVVARKRARQLALQEGWSEAAAFALAIAVSEIARNIVIHATSGEILLDVVERVGRRGIVALARDSGPGIPTPEQAMQDGYSTARGLGLGLSSARRLVDEFELVSAVGQGTTVVMTKWARNDPSC
jgi:serine/threonine-protein kinase RsbT